MVRRSHRTLEGWRPRGKGPNYYKLPDGGVLYAKADLLEWIGRPRQNGAAH